MFINCKTMRRVPATSPEITSRFFKDVRRLKQLTSEEQLGLLQEYYSCENEERKLEIRNNLLLANQPFIISMARHLTTDDEFNDLVIEGNFGMIKAIEGFDITKNNNFLTYATYHIKKAMIDYQCNEKKMVKPKNVAWVYAYSDSTKNKFFSKNGRYPTEEEMISLLKERGISFSNKEDLYNIEICSIDVGFNDESIDNHLEWFDDLYHERNNSDNTSNVTEHIEKISMSQLVQQSLSYLNENEKNFVRKYYGIGCKQSTLTELSYMIGADGDTDKVEKMINKCIKKIRKNGKIQTHLYGRTY